MSSERCGWLWFYLLGVLIFLVGLFGVIWPIVLTTTTIFFLAYLLIVGGAILLIHAISHFKGQGFWLSLLSGLLFLVIGILFLTHPGVSLATLTLFIGGIFLVSGVYRIFVSIVLRFYAWGFSLFSGIISLILGYLVLAHWPSSSLWVLGLFVGIDLIFIGWFIMLTSWKSRKSLAK